MDFLQWNRKLDGLKSLVKLDKLYIGNNLICKINELNNLANLTELKDVFFKGILLL